MNPEFFLVGDFNKAKVNAALKTYHGLALAVDSLTLKELYGAFRAECAGQRRIALLDRLRKRIKQVSLERIETHLQELQINKPQKEKL